MEVPRDIVHYLVKRRKGPQLPWGLSPKWGIELSRDTLALSSQRKTGLDLNSALNCIMVWSLLYYQNGSCPTVLTYKTVARVSGSFLEFLKGMKKNANA